MSLPALKKVRALPEKSVADNPDSSVSLEEIATGSRLSIRGFSSGDP
jgi:hypothetical protein